VAKRKGSGRPVGETLGGMLAGFDQQIFRNQPPPHELVRKGSPVRGLSGQDGGEFELVFPTDDGDQPAGADLATEDAEPAAVADADPAAEVDEDPRP
jgi:hypothetical protein